MPPAVALLDTDPVLDLPDDRVADLRVGGQGPVVGAERQLRGALAEPEEQVSCDSEQIRRSGPAVRPRGVSKKPP